MTGRTKNIEMFNRGQITALPKIFVSGIKTPRVHTNQKMIIFLSWFEKRKDPDLVNATFDGAYIPGVKHIQAGAIELPETGFDIFHFIDDIYARGNDSGERTAQSKTLAAKATKMLDELDSVLPALSRAADQSKELFSIINKGERDRSKYDHIINKLAETDRIIESKRNIKDMISLSMQRVIHTITEGYVIDGGDSRLSEDELVAKKSHYLYKGLLGAAKFNRKVLIKMIKILGP